MLRRMRTADGQPTVRMRLVALVVALFMLLLAAPALVPLLQWLWSVLV